MIVKILGGIDLFAAFIFLGTIFGTSLPFQFVIFPAVLLLIKGLFILSGDILSAIDIIASFILILSIFFQVSSLFLWLPAFFLLSKGVASFL